MLKNLFGGNKEQNKVVTQEDIVRFEKEREAFNKEKEQVNESLRIARAEIKAFKAVQANFYKMMDAFNQDQAMKNGAAVEMLSKEEFDQSIREEGRKAYEAEKQEEESYCSFARNIAFGYFFEEIELIEEALLVTPKGKAKEYSVSLLVELKETNKIVILLVDSINVQEISYQIKRFETMENWATEKQLRGWV